MATKDQYDAARVAVQNGQATRAQEELVRREASQAGLRGSAAREAFKKAGKR